jgi:secreted PhoX family phosphatase
MTGMRAPLDRRQFLRTAGVGGLVLAPSVLGLIACSGEPDASGTSGPQLQRADKGRGGYGELRPYDKLGGIISLPRGFHASLLSTSGTEMAGGGAVPSAFDGMAAFVMGARTVRLVRNHELRDVPASGPTPFADNPYDSIGPAGTTTLEVDVRPDGSAQLITEFPSLTGTFVNCAGGLTPWGSWVTCEETVAGTAAGWAENHGYCFDVPAAANGPVTPVAIKAMGRFAHEALAVDPLSGIVYETEDRGLSGFYRFIPNTPGRLSDGGVLQMLAVVGQDGYDTRAGQSLLNPRQVRWVTIDNADSDAGSLVDGFVFDQGFAKGGAIFARLEGCWYGDDSVFFNATSGGNAGAGQVWQYHIRRNALQLIFESPGADVLDAPDNICVSPRGGIVLCEDGSGFNSVRGLTRSGEIFDLARNNANDQEWAGACFSPQGRTLFVSIQGETRPLQNPSGPKGMTFAIWGPWESGAL